MNRFVAWLLLFAAICLFAFQPAAAVTIDWAPVGNPGNANDSATGSLYGGVGYAYSIGTKDVTNAQYAEFLNTKDPTGANTLGLWNSNMAINGSVGGINFISGNPNGSKYTLISGAQNHPVDFVTWYDAIRFANWLNNGQVNGDTETGAYTLGSLGAGGVPLNGNSITRNGGATIVVPSENEWYKAAYYNPATASYFQYGTGSNAVPISSSPTSLVNHANFFPGGPSKLTDVGAYSGTKSPYGAFDMGGNVWQWNEALVGSGRGVRGGAWGFDSTSLLSSDRNEDDPTDVNQLYIGFRVALVPPVPEPSTLTLFGSALLLIGGMILRRRLASTRALAILIAATALWVMPPNARAEQLLVSGGGATGTIGKYTTSGAPLNVPLVSGLSFPHGIAMSGGNLFVVNNGSGTVGEYTTSGAPVNPSLITGLNANPVGIAVSGSSLFVANFNSGTVDEYNSATGAPLNVPLITGLNAPIDLAVSGSHLFVLTNGGMAGQLTTGTISEYTTSGAPLNVPLVSGLIFPQGIALSGSNLYVTNGGNSNSIGEYTTSGMTLNPALVTGLNAPRGIAVSGGNLFVVYNAGTVGEFDAVTGVAINPALITVPGGAANVAVVPEPSGIALSALGLGALIASLWRRRMKRFTPSGSSGAL